MGDKSAAPKRYSLDGMVIHAVAEVPKTDRDHATRFMTALHEQAARAIGGAERQGYIQISLLPRLCWIVHERRRDLARFDGSLDRASMMFQPCFLAVETKERISAKSIAPCNDRKPPEIF